MNGNGGDFGRFGRLVNDSKRKLYSNCERYSVLQFIVKFLHLKLRNRWSNKSFTEALKLFKDALPDDNLLPDSYYASKKFLTGIGLGCIQIHACHNDCILFRNQYKLLNYCPECSHPRFKMVNGKSTKVPNKILRYFPLTPRIQRRFLSRKTALLMRWHKEKRVEEVGYLSHPADGEAWKDFDLKFPNFAADSRNVRLALSSDGFNPYNNMAKSYSMWPVVVVNYNMPPWEARRRSNLMLSLLIPGPRSPGKEIDVYLQPLIEELQNLWNGVRTYDVVTKKPFTMRAALMWTISDFPAYGDLSGWVTKGKLACPCCNDETSFKSLRNKIAYLGHRRYLPREHRWRKMSSKFDGTQELRSAPRGLSGDEILEQLQVVKDNKLGKNQNTKKRKKTVEERNWSKMSIFFNLPYWQDLILRHNFDVMHIEKNWLDSLMGTLLSMKDKNKDTDKARQDLKDMGIRHELHLIPTMNGKFEKPSTCFTLSPTERSGFYKFLSGVKYPDGYAGNISRCVNIQESKISGLKTHDCHVLLQRVLPIGMRGFLKKEVYTLLCEISQFFRDLCSRKLKIEDLDKLEQNIVIIFCKMEMLFPPALFDIMIHLAVHLPREAKLGGPVQNRWMYPFEKNVGHLKDIVSNKAHPEGSIAETYIINESLEFCALYLNDIENEFSQQDRYKDGGADEPGTLSIFSNKVRPFGGKTYRMLEKDEFDHLRWYVLNNCEEFKPYLIEHEKLLRNENVSDILETQKYEIAKWFMQKVELEQPHNMDARVRNLYELAHGPDMRITTYSGCVVNGINYLTEDRDKNRKTQNSGIRCEGEHNNEIIDFYGVLKEVIELQFRGNHRATVFKCDWFDCRYNKYDAFFTSINMSHTWYPTEPYILAIQANQVFYVQDTKWGSKYHVVQFVDHRHTWDEALFECQGDIEHETELVADENHSVYQQNLSHNPISPVEELEVSRLVRNDVEPEIVDAGISSLSQRGRDRFKDKETESNMDEIRSESDEEDFNSDNDMD